MSPGHGPGGSGVLCQWQCWPCCVGLIDGCAVVHVSASRGTCVTAQKTVVWRPVPTAVPAGPVRMLCWRCSPRMRSQWRACAHSSASECATARLTSALLSSAVSPSSLILSADRDDMIRQLPCHSSEPLSAPHSLHIDSPHFLASNDRAIAAREICWNLWEALKGF